MEQHNYGHPIKWHEDKQEWIYLDGKPNTDEVYQELICPKCNLKPTEDGQDPCISNLKDVKNACCGHGIDDSYNKGYIHFTDDLVIRFDTTDDVLKYVYKHKLK